MENGKQEPTVNRNEYEPSVRNWESFPLALSLVLLGFFLTVLSLSQVRYDLRHLFFSTLWASISVAIAAYVKAHGRIFCNQPRLHKPRR
ncbi:unnamed protein product [Camellia sinensis]